MTGHATSSNAPSSASAKGGRRRGRAAWTSRERKLVSCLASQGDSSGQNSSRLTDGVNLAHSTRGDSPERRAIL